ncbi:hypothetical protein Pcinc_005808 [Petrolisthes cinctipes]|uniref:Uncharacterized protein n=1 Tax=Petrolisthes cinctipes TaxID=88211 RepID=A0AAE1GBZ5_PETCI|nr:hypothetical protein Pcinc_005808 [Petrolisthes cinctipes]
MSTPTSPRNACATNATTPLVPSHHHAPPRHMATPASQCYTRATNATTHLPHGRLNGTTLHLYSRLGPQHSHLPCHLASLTNEAAAGPYLHAISSHRLHSPVCGRPRIGRQLPRRLRI